VSSAKNKSKKDEPAVSRLLSILRSQHSDQNVTEDVKTTENASIKEEKVSVSSAKKGNKEEDNPSEMASSILNQLKSIEGKKSITSDGESDADPEASSDKDIDEEKSSDLTSPEEESVEPESPEKPEELEAPEIQKEEHRSGILKDDFITDQEQPRVQKIQDQLIETKSSVEIVPPPEFDNSLYSNYDFGDPKKSLNDYYYSFLNIFNESSKKLTFHIGTRRLRFLMVKTSIGENVIEKAGIYSLPYKIPESKIPIKEMPELITYILENELNEQERKTAYGAVYNNQSKTKALVFQIPLLKGKEAKDLIAWQIKKNSPGGSNQVVNWEVCPVPGDKKKKNIVVGIGDKSAISRDVQPFKKKKVKLRLNSTVSILLWKLFVHSYPDKKDGTYVVAHIGERATSLIVIKDHQLLFVREITLGAEDLYKSVQQRVVVGNNAIRIDAETSERIFREYGVPLDANGIAGDTGISLYKLSILMRPTIERLTSELNRSLSFFKKENPDIIPVEIMFSGTGACFPNLVNTLGSSVDIPVSLLNPKRIINYSHAEGVSLQQRNFPDLDINFALSLNESSKINILPEPIVNNFKFIFPMKVAMGFAAFLLPFFLGTAILSEIQIGKLKNAFEKRQGEWSKLQEQLGDYTYMLNDIKYLSGFETYLKNDQYHSENALKMLKLVSDMLPEGFKLTNVKTAKERNEKYFSDGGKYSNYIDMNGFLEADQSVASIHFTNFILKLEALNFSHELEYETRNGDDNDINNMLFFNLKIRY